MGGVRGWYRPDSTPVLLGGSQESQYAKLQRVIDTFPDKPVIVTEFGSADSINGYFNWANEKWSENFQAGNVRDSARFILDHPDYSGGMVWQMFDCRSHIHRIPSDRPRGLNNKGILDRYRKPKLAFFMLQEVYGRYIESEQ